MVKQVKKQNLNRKKRSNWHSIANIGLMIFAVLAISSFGLNVSGITRAAPSFWEIVEQSRFILFGSDTKFPTLQLKSFDISTPTPQPTSIPTIFVRADPTEGLPSCEYSGSGPGLEGVPFDEPEVLVDYAPRPPLAAGAGQAIQLWAGDENSIILGAARVNGVTYPIEKNSGAATLNNPQTGAPYNQGGKDAAGRPLFPALFLTDITTDANSRAGDWQQGGVPIPPHFISGTWVESTIDGNDYSQSEPPGSKNVVNTRWNLAPGGQEPGPGREAGKLKSYDDETYYGAELRWYVDQLLTQGHIQPGRVYRAQFMVHDGDGESDVAQGCATIKT